MTEAASAGRRQSFLLPLLGLLTLSSGIAQAEGDAERGAREFVGKCAFCHTVQPGRHRTGPSLANIWGRKAGTAEGFGRYSDALKSAGITWNAATLDAWLEDPRAFIPGNRMIFRGIAEKRERDDIIAYLRAVASSNDSTGVPGRDSETAVPALRLQDRGPLVGQASR